jgi:FkbM family methyltransferase
MQLPFSKIQPYVYPENPIDQRFISRIKRGLVNYAQVQSSWAIPRFQSWIRDQKFWFLFQSEDWYFPIVVSGSDITHLWVANEIFIDKVYDLSIVPFLPDVILDLGSNIGLFSILAQKKWSESMLICVEPHPETFSFLSANLEANKIKATRLQCGVSSDNNIKFLRNDEGAVFQELSGNGDLGNRVLTVSLNSLISSFSDMKLLIKMDIEGAEYEVLQDTILNLPMECFFFIELHKGDWSLSWIKAWAAENDFDYFETRRRDDAIDGYLKRKVYS